MAGKIEDGGRRDAFLEDWRLRLRFRLPLSTASIVAISTYAAPVARPALGRQFGIEKFFLPRYPSMAPSPLRNMPAVAAAAAATECQIIGIAGFKQRTSPTNKNCSVRVHGDLVVSYMLRRVGDPLTTFLHEEAPRRFEQSFDLYDPDTFFGSSTACREAVHAMLTQTPLLRELDLAADNWVVFTPGILASYIVEGFRRGTDRHGGVAIGISLNLHWDITVRIVYTEAKAMLLACTHAAAWSMPPPPPTECCCICMEDLAARVGAVRLPCSHSFHRGCILPWFYKVATCPMCRHDMRKYLVAATNTPMGQFPGLR